IETPQHYGHNPLRYDPVQRAYNGYKELQGWPFFRDFAKPTTGFVSVSRIVDNSSPYFEWIDPEAIISGFDLSFYQADADNARNILKYFGNKPDWYSPEITSDGNHQLARGEISDVSALRFKTLLHDTNAHLALLEMQRITALNGFRDRTYFGLGGQDLKVFTSRFLCPHRLEFLVYEFQLTGESSWDFQVAK
ncbi:MAG: hypothetical protein WAV18_13255, partial [Roseiarcus sp.]